MAYMAITIAIDTDRYYITIFICGYIHLYIDR